MDSHVDATTQQQMDAFRQHMDEMARRYQAAILAEAARQLQEVLDPRPVQTKPHHLLDACERLVQHVGTRITRRLRPGLGPAEVLDGNPGQERTSQARVIVIDLPSSGEPWIPSEISDTERSTRS